MPGENAKMEAEPKTKAKAKANPKMLAMRRKAKVGLKSNSSGPHREKWDGHWNPPFLHRPHIRVSRFAFRPLESIPLPPSFTPSSAPSPFPTPPRPLPFLLHRFYTGGNDTKESRRCTQEMHGGGAALG